MILHYFDQVDSTNDYARRRQLPAGHIVWAGTQSAGRGQYGKTWNDVPGQAVLFSWVCELPDEASAPTLPVLLGGLAARAMEELIRPYWPAGAISPLAIKWPNDIVADKRKLAGILVERDDQDGKSHIIVGMGINLLATPAVATPGKLPPGSVAAWLRTETPPALPPWQPHLWIMAIAGAWQAWAAAPTGARAEIASAILRWVRERFFLTGREILVPGVGRCAVSGMADDCQLRVSGPSGEILIPSADFSLVAPGV